MRVPMKTFTNTTNQNIARAFILNGTPADIENYKFKLSLHIRDTFYCSASVISATFSLTAGKKMKNSPLFYFFDVIYFFSP